MIVEEEIDYLLGKKNRIIDEKDVSIPKYMQQMYSRIAAVELLADVEELTVEVVAALSRVCITDEEDEVRRAALDALVSINSETLKSVLLISVYDTDFQIRLTALEELRSIDFELSLLVAKILKNDEDDAVREYALGLLKER